jgi:hypothetical protein
LAPLQHENIEVDSKMDVDLKKLKINATWMPLNVSSFITQGPYQLPCARAKAFLGGTIRKITPSFY